MRGSNSADAVQPEESTESGYTPLTLAIFRADGRDEVIEMLWRRGSGPAGPEARGTMAGP
jgi:hypothetical protein